MAMCMIRKNAPLGPTHLGWPFVDIGPTAPCAVFLAPSSTRARHDGLLYARDAMAGGDGRAGLRRHGDWCIPCGRGRVARASEGHGALLMAKAV